MNHFIHEQNIAHYRKVLSETTQAANGVEASRR